MPSSTFSYTSADGTQIAAYRWDTAGEPRGLRAAVQLTHGMGEHAQRYEHVARALNEAGSWSTPRTTAVTAPVLIPGRWVTWVRAAGLVGSPGAPAPDNALAPTQRQEQPPRCNIVAVLCATMLHRAGYAKRDQPP